MVASENSSVNKNMFKVDRKDARTVVVNVVQVSFDYLGTYFYICDFQAAIKLVLVKIQAFTINGSDGVCGKACFYPMLCSLFLVNPQAFTVNGSDGD